MKQFALLFFSTLCFGALQPIVAQNITYSVVHSESAQDVNFEILGKVGNNYLVFKNSWERNFIQVFDKDMNEVSNRRIKEIPGKVENVDFITYPNHALIVYQYKQNNVLHCDALKIDDNGKVAGPVVKIDTSRVGMQAGNFIYSTIYSEDKTKILVYKLQEVYDSLHVVTKLYNPDLLMQDSTRSVMAFIDWRDQFSPFKITNDGTIFFTKETKTAPRENIGMVEVVTNKLGSHKFTAKVVNLQKKYIDGVQIKIDNLNNNYIINSFYYDEQRSENINGLFTALVKSDTDSIKVVINKFDDSLRTKVNIVGKFRTAFDNLFLNNIFLKNDGSYVLVAEDYFTQTNDNVNSWNRWDYLYANPYGMRDRFFSNGPWQRSTMQSTRYFYENVLVMGIDSSLKLNWNTVILKKQEDSRDDSFLSYGTLNAGGGINFLFTEKERNTQIITNQGVSATGKLYRYPTLKSKERGYQFMPRLAKQVGAKQIIMPCVFRGRLCFAKIDFS